MHFEYLDNGEQVFPMRVQLFRTADVSEAEELLKTVEALNPEAVEDCNTEEEWVIGDLEALRVIRLRCEDSRIAEFGYWGGID